MYSLSVRAPPPTRMAPAVSGLNMRRGIPFPARFVGIVRLLCILTALPIATAAWAGEARGKKSQVSRLLPIRACGTCVADEGVALKLTGGVAQPPGLLGRYRMALEKESKRRMDKDAGLFILQDDEDGNPVKRTRTEAKRIFGGATGRLLNDFAEILLEDVTGLRVARDYVQGIRVDVMSGGGMRFKAGQDDSLPRVQDDPMKTSRGNSVAASFGLVAIGSPRFEIRATLPGAIRTQVELPLTDPGIRATFSRKLTAHVRGTFSTGIEDSGADKWATLGFGIRF